MFLLLFVYFILMISTSEIGITSSFQYTIHCCFKGDSTEHPGLIVWVLKSITILSATALQILVNRLFAQQIVQAKNKGNIKAPHYWPFARKSTGHWRFSLSPRKRQEMRKEIPCHGVIFFHKVMQWILCCIECFVKAPLYSVPIHNIVMRFRGTWKCT